LRVADEVFLVPPVVGLLVIDPVLEPVALPVWLPVWLPVALSVLLASDLVLDPVSLGELVDSVGAGVALADDELSLLSFCLTTNESNSGNHFGQGQAAANVERKQSNTIE